MNSASQLEQWLSLSEFNYTLTAEAPTLALVKPGETLVRAVLLRHKHTAGQNYVQALVPANYIIDLNQLGQSFGGEFSGIDREQLPKSLLRIPALPQWQELRCIIDSQLFNYDALHLDSGQNKSTIIIAQPEFQSACTELAHSTFSRRLQTLTPNFSNNNNFTSRRLRQRLDTTLELPIMKHSSEQIFNLHTAGLHDINALCHIVENDPSLAMQVVSWAASPYYAAPTQVRSIRDAIERVLGYELVLNLSLSLATGDYIRGLDQLQLERLGRHASVFAHCTTALASMCNHADPIELGLARLAGLLQNFGQILIAELFPFYHGQIQGLQRANPHINHAHVQAEVIGISGNQLAAYLAHSWALPEAVVVALREQWNPQFDGEYHQYARLLRNAHHLLYEHGLADYHGEPTGGNLSQLGIDTDHASFVVEHCRLLFEHNHRLG